MVKKDRSTGRLVSHILDSSETPDTLISKTAAVESLPRVRCFRGIRFCESSAGAFRKFGYVRIVTMVRLNRRVAAVRI